MFKLQTLKPRLKEVDLSRGIKMVKYPRTPTKRVSKADNGRTLPLTSAAWRKLRRSVLESGPLCRMCTAQGRTVIATDVDHRDNDPSNNDILNLVPLCHSCHSLKTNADMGHNVRMGAATDGTPVDPNHHWNKPATAILVRQSDADSKDRQQPEAAYRLGIPSLTAN